MTYQVEIRDLKERLFSCTCPDFRTAGLGTCKHVDATGNLLGCPAETLVKLRRNPKIRISQDVDTFLESRRRTEERLT